MEGSQMILLWMGVAIVVAEPNMAREEIAEVESVFRRGLHFNFTSFAKYGLDFSIARPPLVGSNPFEVKIAHICFHARPLYFEFIKTAPVKWLLLRYWHQFLLRKGLEDRLIILQMLVDHMVSNWISKPDADVVACFSELGAGSLYLQYICAVSLLLFFKQTCRPARPDSLNCHEN